MGLGNNKSKILILPILALFLLSMVNVTGAVTTKETPFYSVGNDFLVVKDQNKHPVIGSLFDDTKIWVDVQNDGVWDYEYERDQAENLHFKNVPISGVIESGARIRTSKPVIYQQKLYEDYGKTSAPYVSPLSSLKSDYISRGGQIIAPANINLSIDYGDTGTINNVKNLKKRSRSNVDLGSHILFRNFRNNGDKLYLSFERERSNRKGPRNGVIELNNGSSFDLEATGKRSENFRPYRNLKNIRIELHGLYETIDIKLKDARTQRVVGDLQNVNFDSGFKEIKITPAKYARFSADEPFYFLRDDSIEAPMAERFYAPWKDVKIFAPNPNTTIKVDKNNDRHFDRIIDLEKIVSSFSFENGAFITSNKPIRLYYKAKLGEYVAASSATTIGSDLWINSPNPGLRKGIVTGIFRDKTNLSYDEIGDYNKSSDYFSEIDVTSESRQDGVKNGLHLTASKPVIGTNLEEGRYDEFYGNMFPYSKITTYHRNRQKYLGAGELSPMRVRVMNPFYNTTVRDLSLSVDVNPEFEVPDPDEDGRIAVSVQKYGLNNDSALTGEQTIEVDYIQSNGEISFELDESDISQLEQLGAYSYLDLDYYVETPEELGSYSFEPVELDYRAKTWKLPSEKGP